jgi:hypothetical protein
LVVDEFDKNQGMKSNSYTQQHLKHDQNHVPHNTFPWDKTRETRETVFDQVGCFHNFAEINDVSCVGWLHNIGETLHEFGDFIILEKANNLNTCCWRSTNYYFLEVERGGSASSSSSQVKKSLEIGKKEKVL